MNALNKYGDYSCQNMIGAALKQVKLNSDPMRSTLEFLKCYSEDFVDYNVYILQEYCVQSKTDIPSWSPMLYMNYITFGFINIQ